MYNGIGLQTPRGSGTSGYVQRNKSYLRPQRTDIKPFRESEAAAPPKPKKADPELIYHNQKREIEVKLIDLQDTLLESGEEEDIVQKKVDKERQKLYKELDDRRADAEAHGGELQADQMASTHEYLQLQKRQAERAAKAFGINTRNHEEGVAFDKDRQHQQKLQRMMDAQARDAERWAAPGGENGDGGAMRKNQRNSRPPAKAGESWRDFAERRKEKGWAAEEREETEEGAAKRREAKRVRREEKASQGQQQQEQERIDFVAKVVTLDDGRSVKLQLWDTAGQERFRSLIPAYLRDTAACVVVFDLTSKESFASVRSWVSQVRDEKGADGGIQIVLVGNKADMAESRQVSEEDAKTLADELGVRYFETSAKSGVEIDEIFTEHGSTLDTLRLFVSSLSRMSKLKATAVEEPSLDRSARSREDEEDRSSTSRSSGRVPHYSTHGHQHHRFPTKSLSGYADVAPIGEWEKEPEVSDKIGNRRANLIPDISYDVDGDGVVGARDYFIAKNFDEDRDGRLNRKERQWCMEALSKGWLDRFSFGHDQAGSKRPFAVQQRRGKIFTQDSSFELGETYPAHPISKVIPFHHTKTELALDRRNEMKNAASQLYDRWERKNPSMVAEQPPSKDNYVAHPKITHIGERAAADNEASRVCAGLMPVNTHLNPDRESKALSTEWVEAPAVRTRSQLMELRREKLKSDLDESRNKGEAEFIPLSVRAVAKEAAAHEFRKGEGAEPKTKTLLDVQRRRDRIEHNLANCRRKPRKMPATNHGGHWVKNLGKKPRRPQSVRAPCLEGGGRGFEARTHHVFPSSTSRVAEVTFKVTEPLPEHLRPRKQPEREEPPIIGDVKPKSNKPLFPEGRSKTVKRWTTDIIEHGALRNGRRLFDSLPPCQVYTKDFAPLEVWSSFDIIRHDALKKQARARSSAAPTVSKLSSVMMSSNQRSDAAAVPNNSETSADAEARRLSAVAYGRQRGEQQRSVLGQKPSSTSVDHGRLPGPNIIDRIAKSGPKMSIPCGEVRTGAFDRLEIRKGSGA
ncbi:hypothetical protein FOZ60_007214 [Perkinsus olseni]|uniref:CWF21 domain-containing protein n=1 Tax=Perkinsus olseni TaxID=32597 RepID=A0A7J6PGT5_PEROL|nr:hypothetical protein FOZ60_007214 [Perkinsus olseni]